MTVHGLAGGGDGVARLPSATDGTDGGVVFVPDTAPGDRVRVQLTRPAGRRRWHHGQLVEVVAPGPGRRPPRCPVSLLCGGCQWHHLEDDAQRLAKQEILARAFRQARLELQPPAVRPAPEGLGYRRRARLGWERGGAEAVRVGFRARRSHRLVAVEQCPVLVPALDALLPRLGPGLPTTATGEVLLLADPGGRCSAVLRGRGVTDAAASTLGEAAGGALAGVAVLGEDGALRATWGTPRRDLAEAGEPSFWGAPEGFAQANAAVNRSLRAVVRQWAAEALAAVAAAADGRGPGGTPDPAASEGPAGRRPVVELYAGSGNFTRDLVDLAPVVAVETDPGAVALGRENLAGRPVTWRLEEAPAALAALGSAGPGPDLVVLDPPRTGAREALAPLVALGPAWILYVSCEPMTLARDAAALVAAGYAPGRMMALDTMPQTAHFETVLEFRRIRWPRC